MGGLPSPDALSRICRKHPAASPCATRPLQIDSFDTLTTIFCAFPLTSFQQTVYCADRFGESWSPFSAVQRPPSATKADPEKPKKEGLEPSLAKRLKKKELRGNSARAGRAAMGFLFSFFPFSGHSNLSSTRDQRARAAPRPVGVTIVRFPPHPGNLPMRGGRRRWRKRKQCSRIRKQLQ